MTASFNDAAQPVPAGYVPFRGRGTYNARMRLRALGSYWRQDLKAWVVPERRVSEAEAAIRYAEKLGRELTEEDCVEDLVPRMTCFECGGKYSLPEVQRRGGNAAEWYCGCEEQASRKALAGRRR